MKAMSRIVAHLRLSGARRSGSRTFASCAECDGYDHTRAPSFRTRAALAFLLAMSFAVAAAASASADTKIGESISYPFNSHANGLGYNLSGGIAVSEKEGGDILFLNGESLQRVDEFHPDGTWSRAFGFGIVPGAATGTGDIAVGSATITNVETTSGSFSTGGAGGKVVSGPGLPAEDTIIAVHSNELVLSKSAEASGTHVIITTATGPGNVPTNEVEKLVVSATGGDFEVRFSSPYPGSTTETTAAITYNATAASVQADLESLSNLGSGNVTVSGGPGDEKGTTPYLITFEGKFADTNVRSLSVVESTLTGGSPSSAASVTTPTQGGGITETCTTVCGFPSSEEPSFEFTGEGRPGSFNWSHEMAIDNEPGADYGDVYVVDQRNYRVEKFGPNGEFLLMFGGEINKDNVSKRKEEEANSEPISVTEEEEDICTATEIAAGAECFEGVPGTGPSHFYHGSFPNWWNLSENNSIAVGPGGTVYVGDYGRIQEFAPTGAYIGELSLPDGGEPKFVIALAVDSAGDIFERSATSNDNGTFASQVPGIREYDATHKLVRTIDTETGSDPRHIALNDADELFVSDNNSGEFEFKSFKADGALHSVFTSPLVANQKMNARRIPVGIAIGNAEGKLYAASGDFYGGYVVAMPLPVYGTPTVLEETTSNLEPTTATLHGIVNPSGFNTEYYFQYVDQTSYEQEGGFASAHTEVTPIHNLDYVNRKDPVVEGISGLQPGTVYHYRIVAKNSEGTTNGADETFESLTPFSVRNFTTQVVGPNFVKLKTELNPNGASTTYTVELGRTLAYGEGSVEGSLPIGNEFEAAEFQFPGLEANTTYHYRITGGNKYGTYSTPDQTFVTERSAGEEHAQEVRTCPNTNLREENGSLSLPDCRSYEQVSEADKAGGQAFGNFDLAPGGEHDLYIANGAFAGAEANPLAIYYLAHRTPTGWVTVPTDTRPAGVEYQPQEGLIMTPEMDRWLFAEQAGTNAEHTNPDEIFYSMGFEDGTAIAQVTPTLTAVNGGYVQSDFAWETPDLSTLLLASNQQLLAGDPLGDGHPRLYEISGVGSGHPEMKLLLSTPPGLTDQTCRVDDFLDRSQSQTYARSQQVISKNNLTMVYTMPFETAAGGKCGPGTEFEGRPNQYGLYAQVGNHPAVQVNKPLPSECSSPSPCYGSADQTPLYDGVSGDGTRVWFTTSQPLVNEDHDLTNDLYVGRLNPETGEVAELVLASAGKATPSHPTPGKGAELGEEGIDNVVTPAATNQGVIRVSPDGSTAAFESMKVLTTEPNGLGETAIPGANNMYTYNAETHETKFMAIGCSGPGLTGTDRPNRKGSGIYYLTTEEPEVLVPDSQCPPGIESDVSYVGPQTGNDVELWFGNDANGEAIFSEDGRYLFFTAYARLTPDDTDNVKDLFRFDTQTGQLIRLSSGRNGNDANGNDGNEVRFEAGLGGVGGPHWAQEAAGDGERKISADGSVAIFETSSPLVSHDTNGRNDVYEWEEGGHGTCSEPSGCVSLISDGVAAHGADSGLISSSGKDITFRTSRSEVPGDTDVVGDIYDARVDGGFHAVRPPIHCGNPEGCRGAQEPSPQEPQIGSESFAGSGNQAQHLLCAKGKRRIKRHGQIRCVAKRHRKHSKRRHHKRAPRRARRKTSGGSK